MPYNASDWNSDTAHYVRFGVDVSLGGLGIIYALVIGIVMLLRFNHFPLKAHGLIFLIVKFVCFILEMWYFILIMPVNNLGNAILNMWVSNEFFSH